MTREKILEVIKQSIIENLDDVEYDSVDPQKAMTDYGANSLDIVEIVSNAMRELNIKMPRSQLADIANIDQLVDKLYEHVNQETQE